MTLADTIRAGTGSAAVAEMGQWLSGRMYQAGEACQWLAAATGLERRLQPGHHRTGTRLTRHHDTTP
jgi:hypothetical protein